MIELRLDKKSFVPFYRQIVDMVLAGIASGNLLPGERLPTIRDLAVKLEVNPNTVVKAYSQLQFMNVLDMQQGTGAFICAKTPQPMAEDEKQRMLMELCRDFVGRAQLQNATIDEMIKCLQEMRKQT
jgi:GntR family transcriptional regulator